MRAFKRGAGVNEVSDLSTRPWRELVTDWKTWLSLGVCLLIATLAFLLGYD
jgi:ABC-type spermidine/putrescine transport system permease subunit II